MVAMTNDDPLALDDDALLAQCEVHYYKSSGPGGQHRNKVSSAVRLHHRRSGVSAHGDDSRSQHDNKKLALRRLRMNIACQIRREMDRQTFLDAGPASLPAHVAECIFTPRGRGEDAPRRLEIGVRDFRFWRVAAFLLDVLHACGGRMADAAACLGITTGNFSDLLTSERHLLASAQAIRKTNGLKPLS
ncbi:MAG: peptide chain release factor-like protein [Phycisphaerae bacterium]|nr:peptide chain release factor-like protein [Phycisphaerae bacterium]